MYFAFLFLVLISCGTHVGLAVGFTIPQQAADPEQRASAINTTRSGFLYGPPVAGGPFYPDGELGKAKRDLDVANSNLELGPQQALVRQDIAEAGNSTDQYEGLDSVEDYLLLYKNQWKEILPDGPSPGVLTNYSQDLFFSMERLANNAFSVRRLPRSSDLPFQVDASSVSEITGSYSSSLENLLKDGRLFYADHSTQASRSPTVNKFAAACDAYFYISEKSGEFLPLAIRTNVGTNLIYTPVDEAADWMLAKIMFNVNDFYFSQTWHLASTHEVVQIAWMAAIRTLSVDHPIYALLDRLTYQLFSMQLLAQGSLFDPGTAFDLLFPITGSATRDFVTELYFNGTGAFQEHYFEADLQRRGLINGDGPKLTHFPFYEDASVIYNAQREFITAFVKSFYSSDSVVSGDTELQAWAAEANGPAKAIDFPTKFATVDGITDALTHIAHLSSAIHHAINTNNLVSISLTLPMHPSSLYKPVPATKGNTSVAEYLPPLQAALSQFRIEGLFARPLLENSNRTLAYMFDSPAFLDGTNEETKSAAATFKMSMEAFSKMVKARTFDEDGLSQGAPFVWQQLDPLIAPFSLTI